MSLSRPQPAAAHDSAPEPQDPEDRLTRLADICVRTGYQAARMGPVVCGLIGATAGLAGELLAPTGGLTTVLITATLGGWLGYDTRQAAHGFALGPDSRVWQKRAETTWGLTPALQGGQIVSMGVGLAAGLTGAVLTGSYGGGLACSIVAYMLTNSRIEKASKEAERKMLSHFYGISPGAPGPDRRDSAAPAGRP